MGSRNPEMLQMPFRHNASICVPMVTVDNSRVREGTYCIFNTTQASHKIYTKPQEKILFEVTDYNFDRHAM